MGVKVHLLRVKKDGTKVFGLKINHQGKRTTLSIGTRQAAEAAKRAAEYEIARKELGLNLEKSIPTFGEIAEEYIELIRINRAKGTYTRYKGILKKFLLPVFGKVQVDQISRADIRRILLAAQKKGYALGSIEQIHTVASGVFMYALDDELITTLPTQLILKRLGLKRTSKEVEPFTAAQMEQIIDTVPADFRDFFLCAFHTGARVGELCALTWADINFSDSYIKIAKTAKDQHIQDHTKTYMVRKIDISSALTAALVNLKKEDKKRCFALGIPQYLVFHNKGKVLAQNTIRRRLQKACEKIGVDRRKIHDIRHTTASILLSRGTPLLYVSKLLGHSSPKMTLERYSHYMESENKGLINKLDEGRFNEQNTIR